MLGQGLAAAAGAPLSYFDVRRSTQDRWRSKHMEASAVAKDTPSNIYSGNSPMDQTLAPEN